MEENRNNEIEEVRNEDLYEQEHPIVQYENDEYENSSKPLVIGVVGGIAALAVGGVLLWKRRKAKKKGKKEESENVVEGECKEVQEESEETEKKKEKCFDESKESKEK